MPVPPSLLGHTKIVAYVTASSSPSSSHRFDIGAPSRFVLGVHACQIKVHSLVNQLGGILPP